MIIAWYSLIDWISSDCISVSVTISLSSASPIPCQAQKERNKLEASLSVPSEQSSGSEILNPMRRVLIN